MSDSAIESPDSSDGYPPTPVDQDSPPANTESPPSDSPPIPVEGEGPPPPSEGQDSSSSPSPSDSNNSQPSPLWDSGSSSPLPPLGSDSSPPSDSKSSPPTPSSYSHSSQPPPPSGSDNSQPSPPSMSNSSAPPPPSGSTTLQPFLPIKSHSSPPSPVEGSLFSSPPNSSVAHPPRAVIDQSPSPPSGIPPPSKISSPSPPNSPPESLPTPAVSNYPPPLAASSSGSSPPVQTITPPLPETPPSVTTSPQLPGSPPATATLNPTPSTEVTPSAPSIPTPPASRTSNLVPTLTPPSTHSDPNSSTPVRSSPSSMSSGSSGSGIEFGATVAGVIIIALVTFFFVILRRKKRQAQASTARYRSKPDSLSVKSDEHYYRKQHVIAGSGQSDGYFNGKPLPSPSATGNSNVSYRGNFPNSGGPESDVIGGSKSWFRYEELMEITNGFSRQNVLGEGGFGCVYKGWLPDGRVVAVKQLKAGSGQGEREFRAEIEIISRVHHRHLVSLVGYCIAEHHKLLVYEFVPNNNLAHHLHGKGMPVLEWSKRVKIAVGAARGLAYLHQDCQPKIIHRDIKSANILLDDAFEAKVADFGLAKLSNDTHTHVSTRVMGTFGYVAPEYASSGKLTDRSDVFSFGVVLLELVTGRKPLDPAQPLGNESLVEWARPLLIRALDSGDFTDLADPRLEKRYVKREMFRMIEAATACVRHSSPKRPRMVQVVRALDGEGDILDLTNGVKFGQSTAFESGQNGANIQILQRMAFGNGNSSEYDMYSEDYNSREVPHVPPSSWKPRESSSVEFRSSESDSHTMNPQGSEWSTEEAHGSYGNSKFNQK